MAGPFVDSARAAAQRAGVPIDAAADADPLHLDPALAPWLALGVAFEAALGDEVRAGRGVHFTPPWLARAIVDRVVDAGSGPVIDPACGGGAFVLAALDRLVACGVEPADALDRVVGYDVDCESLDVVEVAARWWAHAHDVGWREVRLVHADALAEPSPPGQGDLVPVVVGNPPFLDQLDRRSARSPERRVELRERFGPAVAAYTDDAALFLHWAIDAAGTHGRVAMVVPRSLLAARDSEGVRAEVGRRSSLKSVWFDDPDTFAAGVRVCVVFTDPVRTDPNVEVTVGVPMRTVARLPQPRPGSWAPLLAAAEGTPAVTLPDESPLADRAEVIAGFRDEYYGLVPAVTEAGRSPSGGSGPTRLRLVTSGSIDLARLRWTDGPVRFAKRRWIRPMVDPAAIEDPAVETWVRRQLRPKIMVATQTRVLEVVVDHDGDCVGSVPVISVIPEDPGEVWLIAAAIASPPLNAWALARRAGAALTAGAIKITAADLRAAPTPVGHGRWAEGATAFAAAQTAPSDDEREQILDEFGLLMIEAYRCEPIVFEWWAARRRAASGLQRWPTSRGESAGG